MVSSPKEVAVVPASAGSSSPSEEGPGNNGQARPGDVLRSSVRAGADVLNRAWNTKHDTWIKLTTWAAAIGQAAKIERPPSKTGQSED